MAKCIKKAAVVIICCSKNYDERADCVRELEFAMSFVVPGPKPYNKHIFFVNCGEGGFDPRTSSALLKLYIGENGQIFDNQTPEAFERSFPILLANIGDCLSLTGAPQAVETTTGAMMGGGGGLPP